MKGLQFIGLDVLEAALVKKIAAEKKASNVVKKHGGQLQEKAMRHAPVDTGHLKNSIMLSISTFEAQVESTAEYAVYQEYGTRYQAGTPHIRPAYQETKRGFIDDMKKVIK